MPSHHHGTIKIPRGEAEFHSVRELFGEPRESPAGHRAGDHAALDAEAVDAPLDAEVPLLAPLSRQGSESSSIEGRAKRPGFESRQRTSSFHEFCTVQYGTPPSVPQPTILTAWAPM